VDVSLGIVKNNKMYRKKVIDDINIIWVNIILKKGLFSNNDVFLYYYING
jgi:hypothetical protein